MTMFFESVERLSARLPELEWKLSLLGKALNPKLLPRGMFRDRLEFTAQSCADEIKAELTTLKQQTNERSARYLADRISQKINVLVRLCHVHLSKKMPERQVNFGVQTLSTRQQWLQALHDDIVRLATQQQALTSALITLRTENNTQAILSLQAELGEADRRLTLAKETLARATRW